jgi:hypothetical protein
MKREEKFDWLDFAAFAFVVLVLAMWLFAAIATSNSGGILDPNAPINRRQ